MFSDPQSLTINAVPHSLPRVSSGSTSGIFRKDDGTVKLTISHAENKRLRRMARVDHSKLATDPYVAGNQLPVNMAVYLVADVPLLGYSVVEQKQVIDAFAVWMTASSGANITKFLGGEI